MVYYIYFTNNFVCAGEYESDNKKDASIEIHKMIREKTSEPYGCLISDKINFVEEVNKQEDVEEYISQLINQMGEIKNA
jgi:hypothetical protein